MECTVQPSSHTINRMVERGISMPELLETLNKGVKRLDGTKVMMAHRGICAVCRKVPCHIFVITVYWKE